MTRIILVCISIIPFLAPTVHPQDVVNCLPAEWLPDDYDHNFCDGMTWDGSKVPDCTKFSGQVNTTSWYHVHEYDCGLFWECGPSQWPGEFSTCLMECAPCNVNPHCPDGRLQFDCRYAWPFGPVCDFANHVGCQNCKADCEAANCPVEQSCDISTDCLCSDCIEDADCPGAQHCCDRSCADNCDCPTECCADEECPDGYECVNGECQCANTCCADTDCPDGYECVNGECQCATDCCADTDCPDGQTCIDGVCTGTTTISPPTTTTTPCIDDCCSDADCEGGYVCLDGNCEVPCTTDSECEGFNAICNIPAYDNCQYCSQAGICENGCANEANCPESHPLCSGIHSCGAGVAGLIKIEVKTAGCISCSSSGGIEGGLVVTIADPSGQSCTSNGLDNLDRIDYQSGNTAAFLADQPSGLGGCEYKNLNYDITSGEVTWTGSGTWLGAGHNPLCFYYFDIDDPFYLVYNCCDLANNGLAEGESTQLTNCRKCVLGRDCA